jgi:hypothetical protein
VEAHSAFTMKPKLASEVTSWMPMGTEHAAQPSAGRL